MVFRQQLLPPEQQIFESLSTVGIKGPDILNIYLTGSRLYQTFSPDSDWDFTVVLNDSTDFDYQKNQHLDIGDIDATIISAKTMKESLQQHDMQRVEHLWLDPKFALKNEIDFSLSFTLDLVKLRVSVSKISKKCIGYAKILWEKENDPKRSKKNLSHSIRFVVFGIQIAKHGKIVDYEESNVYHQQIMAETSEDWSYYFHKYKTLCKSLYQTFSELVPSKELSDKKKERKLKFAEKRKQLRAENKQAKREARNQPKDQQDSLDEGKVD